MMVATTLPRHKNPTPNTLQNQIHEVHQCLDGARGEIADVKKAVDDIVSAAHDRALAAEALRRLFLRGIWAVVLTVITAGSTVAVQNWFFHTQTVNNTHEAAVAAHQAVVTTDTAEAQHFARDQVIIAKLEALEHKHK